jgi:cell division protein FtsI (penicillin-binding protein 3)
MKRARFSRGRLVITYVGIVAFWLAASTRLFQIQISMHDRACELAQKQVEGWFDVPAQRGTITDRKGRVLAIDQPKVSIAAMPGRWTESEARRAAKRFARLTQRSESEWLKRFERSPKFVYVARAVDSSVVRLVKSWQDPAIFELPEQGRSYPTGGVGTDLLGFVDVDGIGRGGIEAAFDEVLRGQGARVRVDLDATRDATIVRAPAAAAVDGHRLQLTVDWEWQSVAEAAVDSAVHATRALGGGVILMTPQGALRAIAYVSNPERDTSDQAPRCRPVTDIFEPGSIFKVISAVALLSERKVRLGDTVYAENGEFEFGGRKIRDSEKHGWLTFAESFSVSSNIAFGKWAQRLDGTQWYRWVHDFGFGDVTGCGLPAEPRGLIPSHVRWNDLHKAQLAMGHSVAVTPLQMVTAFAALANGGDLYKPYLVEAVTSSEGDTLETKAAKKVRHLVPRPVVQEMKAILLSVVTEGTAKVAHSDVIDVAGKTGTAQKVREDGRGYYQDRYIASFVGYFPADQPQVVGIVYLDEPRTLHWGGYTAAPTFTRLAERLAALDPTLLRYPQPEEGQRTPRDLADPPMQAGVLPDLSGLPLSRAITCASQCGFLAEAEGTGFVLQQSPAPGTTLDSCRTVKLVAAVSAPPDSTSQDSTALAYVEGNMP